MAADGNLILQASGKSENTMQIPATPGISKAVGYAVSRHRSPAKLTGSDAQVLPDPPGSLIPWRKAKSWIREQLGDAHVFVLISGRF